MELIPANSTSIKEANVTIDLGSDFTAENICAGKTIFGRAGVVSCGNIVNTDIGKIKDQNGNFVLIPIIGFHHAGFNGRQGDVENPIPNTNTSTLVNTSYITNCGESIATVAERIEDCNFTADLTTQGWGTWKLVTKTTSNTYQVWLDENTGPIWSDKLGQINHCIASGDTVNLDAAALVAMWGPAPAPNTAYNCRLVSDCSGVNPPVMTFNGTSWCAEDPNLQTPAALDEAKGNMRLAATGTSPSIEWRLPSYQDYLKAIAHGMEYVLPNLLNNYWWTNTISSSNYGYAIAIEFYDTQDRGYFPYIYENNRTGIGSDDSVRCVGKQL
jgi:hypothetical protein